MKIIILTLPEFWAQEVFYINKLFSNGLKTLHLRKPKCGKAELEGLIREIQPEFRNRIVLHDHFELAVKYKLKGVHLNSRNPEVPGNFKGTISKSLHNVEELVKEKDKFDYVSLSPIFDSVSKVGYNSKFSIQQLQNLKNQDVIDNKVMALGGITLDNLSKIEELGFGGAMVLGDAWKNFDKWINYLSQAASYAPTI